MRLNVVGASHAALIDFVVGDASVTAEGAAPPRLMHTGHWMLM